MAKITPDLLERALARDRLAIRELLAILRPVLVNRIERVLRCRGAARYRDVHEEVNDLFQIVCIALFENEGRLVRMWDPTRGMSFENFAGLIAEQKAAATFRTRRDRLRLHGTDEDENEDCCIDVRTPERLAMSRDALRFILNKIRSELDERGSLLFELIIVQQRSVEEVCHVTSMSESAVYAWRSRLGRRIEEIAREVLS
ncbi:RNA polymerase sigma factor [Polyangium aurulentum]|uniref:RNA polymerase sigma factor n=1 Tax=Polyangium aurulentum TaxID=2567896 RepID=UPI00146D6983|nr:sigma-70 family RNA polymerase sigma factor [Polyangium aurulentum]UQA61380.1 sigma-70 family RNA polymerase sigma factor [Polyangium aurulentum]